jgi:predicted nucleic acid-binding protein
MTGCDLMELLDTNVLIQAAYAGGIHHSSAAALVKLGLENSSRFCIAPQNLVEFAAVATRPRFVNPPMPPETLARMLDLLYRSRRLAKIYPRRGTVIRAVREGTAIGIAGPVWYDLFLAITMRDAGVETIVTDNVQDFRNFPFITALSIEDATKSLT